MSVLKRLLPDRFVLYLLLSVGLASLLPARGQPLHVLGWVTTLAIALLFFLHGARLSRDAIVAGVSHWRLHLSIFSTTFLVFPIMGLALRPVLQPLVTPELYVGVLFLCCLPATVQSAIAFTSIARGNIPAAVCSAAASSLIGIFLTPVLVGVVIATSSSVPLSYDVVGKIMLQLLLPFVLGQIARRWIGNWIIKRKALLKFVDQGSILLVVYVAFSGAINDGLWVETPVNAILGLFVCSVVLLAGAMIWSFFIGRLLNFTIADQITALFCGSKKSLASGVPMAQVIFSGGGVGAVVLPLMLFHQLQLMVSALLASKLAKRAD